jgi:hypothetical protein
MAEQLFLSEYLNGNRTAWVCRHIDLKDFVVIGYINGVESMTQEFPTEQSADDYAEDWVFKNNE